MTTPSPQDTARFIPAEHLRDFLAFVLEQESPDLAAADEQMAELVSEIVKTLGRDPRNPLAMLVIKVTGMDDLDQADVAKLYSGWAARKLLGA